MMIHGFVARRQFSDVVTFSVVFRRDHENNSLQPRSRPKNPSGTADRRRVRESSLETALSHPARRGSLAAPCRLAKPLTLLNPSLTVRQVVSSKNG
jgi:hypothetical protein